MNFLFHDLNGERIVELTEGEIKIVGLQKNINHSK